MFKKYKSIPYEDIDRRRREVYESYENALLLKCREMHSSRQGSWRRDYASIPAYEESISSKREELKAMLGWWKDVRPPLRTSPEERVLEEKDFSVGRIRLNIVDEIWTDCLLLIPRKRKGDRFVPLIVQHGYGGAPEAACGLVDDAYKPDYSYQALGARAAEKGYFVIAPHHPTGYGLPESSCIFLPQKGERPVQRGKNRLHRLALLAGTTLFGIDMYGLSRAVDYLETRGDVDVSRLGMYGLSQGGMSALYFPALDTRVKASVCSAYFNDRLKKMIDSANCKSTTYLDAEEEDKFLPGMLGLFSDADLVSLICPRAFCAETGRLDTSVCWEDAEREFQEAKRHYEKLGMPGRIAQIVHERGHVSESEEAFEFLRAHLLKAPDPKQ